MKDRRVAKRYATALFRLALEIGKVEEIDAEALTLETVFADKALLRFFSQPQISRAKKRKFSEYPDLRVTKAVDASIIGGAKVYLGRHTVIDGSISTRLVQMKDKLLLYKDY